MSINFYIFILLMLLVGGEIYHFYNYSPFSNPPLPMGEGWGEGENKPSLSLSTMTSLPKGERVYLIFI